MAPVLAMACATVLWGLPALGVACDSPQVLDVQAGVERVASDWREFSASGSQLLREQGWLSGVRATGHWRCGPWLWQAALSQHQGERLYDGQTNTGTPLQTATTLAQTQGYVQGMRAVGDAWALGLRLGGQAISRDIGSTATVSGYPEYYEWALASVGAQWQQHWGERLQVGAQAWWGQALSSRMRVSLPGRDRATLGLGDMVQTEWTLHLRWKTTPASAWTAELAWGWKRLEMAQGPSGAITTNGVLSGSAYQPRTVWEERPLTLAWDYRF